MNREIIPKEGAPKQVKANQTPASKLAVVTSDKV